MSSKFKNILIGLLCCLVVACATTSTIEVSSNNIVSLNDAPAIKFSTSGWAHTNTTNPFLLTPDYLTNAMLGVSRMKSGESFPNQGPVIPIKLNPDVLESLLREKLSSKSELKVSKETINNRVVAIANYADGVKNGIEYLLILDGSLVHVLLIAERGQYFSDGRNVARKVVETINVK